ncbi:MAG: nucleotidyltransferase domain-containing protein [Nanoarchaeota archaeon]
MVNIYKLRLTKLQQEILRLLFVKSGSELNQRQVSKYLDVSQPAVKKALPELKKIGFIKVSKDKESRRLSIKLNGDNHKVMQLKRADNLRQIYESGLADYLEMEFAGATIVLFGSYSRGDDIEKSDIDVAVIGRKEKQIDLSKFEKQLGRNININFYESLNRIHKNLKENLCNGIVLAGGVEL